MSTRTLSGLGRTLETGADTSIIFFDGPFAWHCRLRGGRLARWSGGGARLHGGGRCALGGGCRGRSRGRKSGGAGGRQPQATVVVFHIGKAQAHGRCLLLRRAL